jgi:hypothetical protein
MMPGEKRPQDPSRDPDEIDPEVKEVMDDQLRSMSGRAPDAAKVVRKQKALIRAALRAIETRDERAFSAELRRAGVKDGSPEWKKAWEIYRSASRR